MKKFFTLATLLFLVIIVGCHKPESELFSPKNDLVVMGSTLNEPPYPPSGPYADVTIRKNGFPVVIDRVWINVEFVDYQGNTIGTYYHSESMPHQVKPNGDPIYRLGLDGNSGYITIGAVYHSTGTGLFAAYPPFRNYHTWSSQNPVYQTISFYGMIEDTISQPIILD